MFNRNQCNVVTGSKWSERLANWSSVGRDVSGGNLSWKRCSGLISGHGLFSLDTARRRDTGREYIDVDAE